MHRNGDLWFQLPQNFASRVRGHRKRAADGNHGDVNFTERFDLLGRQRMAQIAEVRDANHAEVEDEGGALERGAERLLVDRNVVDQNVSHSGADLIPFGAVAAEPAQNDGITLGEFHVIVIGMFPADGNHVGCDHRRRVHTRRDRIGDDLGSPAGGNLKKIVTKVFDGGIGRRGKGKVAEISCDIRVAARSDDGRYSPGPTEKESNGDGLETALHLLLGEGLAMRYLLGFEEIGDIARCRLTDKILGSVDLLKLTLSHDGDAIGERHSIS